MARDWETLQEKHTIRAQVLVSQRFSMIALDPNPPPSTRLCCARTLTHVGEYVQTMCALALGILVAPSTKTIVALCHLHPLVEVDLPPFVNNFHPKMDLVLDKETFIYALTHFPLLSYGGPLGMVYAFVGLFCP